MRRGAIEMEKIIAWAIGVLLALVLIYFIVQQFLPSNEGGLVDRIIQALTGLGE